MDTQNRFKKFQKFKELHQQSSTFVLPNAWDAMSARTYQEEGFQAVGTTSAGISISLGYPDGENLPFEMMLSALKIIVNSVSLPVSADIEGGYGIIGEELTEKIKQIILTGVVAINIEDGTGDPHHPITDLSLQLEKIAIIREISQSMDMPLFINARTDLYWLNIGNLNERLKSTINRTRAYQEAGADCVFIPGLRCIDSIRTLRQEISCPINLLAESGSPSLEELSNIGIERVSCGSAPFRATVTLLKKISRHIMKDSNLEYMNKGTISYKELASRMEFNRK
ncbi:dihydrouridine synthase [Bacillus endophyticus]|uniref:isocitrate lyase/PEP mutase family protein n=1 Tax=Priestia endophytica TaxID=135735 RepID=UPI0018CEB7DB|nr:isocitrate lyase/phosphoenolpyruvate mutase family protein [Priestia endophytica]MBG9811188.1 dihydrouridine synthase [Priestia endophytica]